MPYQVLPLFKTSLKIFKFWSLILRYDWRRYACLVPTFFLNVCQLADIIFIRAPLEIPIQNVYIFVLWFNSLLRASSIVYYRHRYEEFMEELSMIYEEIRNNEGEEMNLLLEQTNKSAQTLEIANMALAIVASIGIVLFPLFSSSRGHPFGMYIPGVDKSESPWYEIIYLYQVVMTPVGYCMYIPFTSIVIAFLLFGILMCKVLQHHLRNLKNLEREKVWTEVVWCIRYQNRIIRYVDTINSMTTYIYLVEFLTFGALLCALLFLVNMAHRITELAVWATYITAIFSQVAAIYWFANELSEQSIGLANAAYDSNWIEFDLKTQKALLFFIARAQKPCSILAGRTYPMSLEMFQSLVNVAYSYFTLLRRFYE